jgi:hypothetical protein
MAFRAAAERVPGRRNSVVFTAMVTGMAVKSSVHDAQRSGVATSCGHAFTFADRRRINERCTERKRRM